MTYTTLTYQGVEKTLADWNIARWSRAVQNQANDDLTFSMPTPMDGADIFPYGANVIIQIGRIASAVNPNNPTLPVSVSLVPSVTFSGGTQWFWGYCVDNDRSGDPGSEYFNYRFVGPYQFFFERLIFQKLMLNWNGTGQIADWQSDVVLGLSLTTLTGTGATVQGSTATNLMSIAQQIKEISGYAQADSEYQQSTNGLGWPAGVQFQCDKLTTLNDEINYDLLESPSANVLIQDFAGNALAGKTSASALPVGSYILRAPLDAANAITCKEAMQRELQWLGGIGSPVVWTDHSQTPPQLHIALRSAIGSKSLPLSGLTVKAKIKKRTDLIPAAVHFKYKISGSALGQPYTTVQNNVAAYISGVLVEGIGQLGALTTLSGGAISGANQTALMAAAKTATAIVQTFDFQGSQVNAASCKIVCNPVNLVDPGGVGSDQGFWAGLFPELKNTIGASLKYCTTAPTPVIVDAESGVVYYQNGAWTAAANNGAGYTWRVADGQVASWMLTSANPVNPVAGKTVKATITVHFQYQQQVLGLNGKYATIESVGYEEKNITVTLTTLPSGTYYSAPSETVGEPVPYGLAGYILALETIPQYEGTITLQENEITDQCPIGNVLNITGGLPEWAAMSACVQSVRYSDNGQTEISFGPAKHLGPAQFIARFRNNIGPRWFNLIGSDPLNQSSGGAAQLGSNIPAQAPTDGGKNSTLKSFLTNLAAQTGASGNTATLPMGIHHDTGAAPTTFTGATPSGVPPFAGLGPVNSGTAYYPNLTIAQGPGGGNPGESNSWIRLSINDLKNGTGALPATPVQIYLQEIPVCVNNNGTLVQMYQMFLCSAPYATSLNL